MEHTEHTGQRTYTSWFAFALLLIVALAAVPRLLSYDFSLPYVDHPDEPTYYIGGRQWRGLMDYNPYYNGFPPAYLTIHYTTQPLLEALGAPGLSASVRVLRLAAVGMDLLTIVFIALTARAAAGAIAGLVAGAAWASAPLVLENAVYALPDPPVYLLVSISLWLAAVALTNPERRVWALWSVAVGVVANLFKYTALPVVAPGVLVALWLWTQDRRTGWRLLWLQALLIAPTLVYVYLSVSALGREGAIGRTRGFSNLLDPERALSNIYHAWVPLIPLAAGVVCGLGAAAWVLARWQKRPTAHLGIAALCVVLVIGLPWVTASFALATPTYRMRDVLPGTVAACVLFGAALAQIVALVPARRRGGANALAVLAVTVLVFVPQGQASWRLVEEREPPDRRAALRQWAEASLDVGTVIVGGENHKTFNNPWSGVGGPKWFDWWITEDVLEYPLDEWRDDRGMSYVVLTNDGVDDLQEREGGRAFLASLLYLRDFDFEPGRGPEMAMYRLWGAQYAADTRFGEAIRLVGYDAAVGELPRIPAQGTETLRATAGDTLTLRFYWRADNLPAGDYSLFVHLTPMDGADVLAQADGSPARPERPTPTWDDPDETLIGQPFTLTIPPDLAPGDYALRVGLYDYRTGARLPVGDGDSLLLTTVGVE